MLSRLADVREGVQMTFRRKLYGTMLGWKADSKGRSALLVEGARRVGKTTIAKAFAANEYESSLFVDFSQVDNNVRAIFDEHRGDIDTLLRMLQLYFGVKLTPRHSIVIFDEVQRFPVAREMIKHLVADGRFDYIETGSLISIRKNVQDIVIPSEEERVKLWSLDFEEYLWALGRENLADEVRRCHDALRPLPDSLHRQCMRLFNEYMLVGGMPQSVSDFIETSAFTQSDKTKRQILALYAEDIEKFGASDARRAYSVFMGIPGQLSAGSKRFKFSTLGRGSRYRQYESALRWLEDAHVVSVCRLCNDPNVGFKLAADEGEDSSLKCYMADTGLLVSSVFDEGAETEGIYRALQFGKLSINRGMFVENAIAQQLRSNGRPLYYYSWDEPPIETGRRPRPREIDFLVTRGFSDAVGKPRVSPIEAKSTKTYSTISLDDFRRRFGKRVGDEIVLHPGQLKKEGTRIYLPLYMSFCI